MRTRHSFSNLTKSTWDAAAMKAYSTAMLMYHWVKSQHEIHSDVHLIIKCSLWDQKAKFRLHLYSYNLSAFRKNSRNPWSSILWSLNFTHTKEDTFKSRKQTLAAFGTLCSLLTPWLTLKHCAFLWYSIKEKTVVIAIVLNWTLAQTLSWKNSSTITI